MDDVEDHVHSEPSVAFFSQSEEFTSVTKRHSRLFPDCNLIEIIPQYTLYLPGGKGRGKAVPLQAWSDPEGSRKLRFLDFMTTAQDGGKVVSLTHRSSLPQGNTPGTHFC
jgi:hypothetical protein